MSKTWPTPAKTARSAWAGASLMRSGGGGMRMAVSSVWHGLWPWCRNRARADSGTGKPRPCGRSSPTSYHGGMAATTRRVLLARPRGYCAGVDRAVQAVEKALERYGPPVYVRKQIVHNTHVVRALEQRGAIFVDETDAGPDEATIVFSAHGVSPQVRQQATQRSLNTIDATCPLVTKVHSEARRFAGQDYDILLIGHEGHEEVEGTTGEAPAHVHLVDGPGDVASV